MRMSRVGNGIVAAGAVVGTAAALGITSGFHIEMSPFMTQVIIYKGIAAAAIGLIVAGSWIARRGRQEETAEKPADMLESGSGAFVERKPESRVSPLVDDHRSDI